MIDVSVVIALRQRGSITVEEPGRDSLASRYEATGCNLVDTCNGARCAVGDGPGWVLVDRMPDRPIESGSIVALLERAAIGDVDGVVLASPVTDTIRASSGAELDRDAHAVVGPLRLYRRALLHELAPELDDTDELAAVMAGGGVVATVRP